MVNSGSTYNRMVRKLLEGAQDIETYVDDVLGHTINWNRHIQMLRDFFERVHRANLCLRPSKCKIGFDTVDFLGHTIQKDSIGPQVENVGKILNAERPKTKKDCRSLLGMVNFYRRYIPNCAQIIAPITDLTRSRASEIVKWGDSQEWAFNEIKHLLSSEPILKLPDLNKEFLLQTDASNRSLGDVSSRNMMG